MHLVPSAIEFVEYLCSLPNSPLKMTGDLFVTLSSVAILAFGQFVVNSNTVTSFVLGLGGFRHKRVWEDVERTYYRKRRRVRSEFDDFPVVKKSVFSQNVNGKESSGFWFVLQICNRMCFVIVCSVNCRRGSQSKCVSTTLRD